MRTLALLLALAPLVAHAEPLDYDYVYLSSTDTDTGGGDEERGDTAGAFWTFADTLHLFGSLDDAGSYVGRGADPDWDYEVRTLRLGVGGHYYLGERAMIAPSVAVVHARREIDSPAWPQPRKDDDTGYGLQLDFRYAVTNWLELTAGGRHSRVFDASRNEFVGGVLLHPTSWLALGVLHHEDDDDIAATELTLRWYY